MPSQQFKLPDLGEGLEDAEIVRWMVVEGDEVSLNQPLVEVDTAKALVEIPSPFAGKVVTLHAGVGDVVAVGAALVTIDSPAEGQEGDGKKAVLVGYGVEEMKKPVRRRRLSSPKVGPAAGSLAAPVVRRLAQELGVDLSSVAGTGPGGRITREDVTGAAEEQPPAPAAGDEERVPVKGVRRLVAKRISEAVRTIPHVTTFLTLDAKVLLEVRDVVQEQSGDKVTPLAVIAKAFVEICKRHPKLNASWDEPAQEIVLKHYYHLGIATDTERGLVVTVLPDADGKTIADIAREIARLAVAARDGTAKPEELTGSTVTISNVGSFGAEYGTPIINPPESAILAVGVIEDRPSVREGTVEVRPMSTMSLSFDHRILDGAEAGRALIDLKRLLEDRERLAGL
jgi:2-oxoisovalerate dehydrogenase E2 component (dihydrolipoyl transacylase)